MLTQRLAAYGLALRDGSVLLVRASDRSDVPGTWFLPGGGVEHGEAPEAAVVREVAEETGYRCRVDGLQAVLSDVGGSVHTVRVIYAIEILGSGVERESGGTSDHWEWVPRAAARRYRLAPFVRDLI